MQINGVIVGYDPGGNNKHGLAFLGVRNSIPEKIEIFTEDDVESVINRIMKFQNLIGLGVDTLSCWATGKSGWRPADLWLKHKYPPVHLSVMSPNTLSGSMGLSGMSVLIEISNLSPKMVLSETHPKVLYYALTQKKYDYDNDHIEMDGYLSKEIGLPIKTSNDHEWDAAISAYALFMGITQSWSIDLHASLPVESGRIVTPCGNSHYFWPGQL
jgi:hypothetical protein